MTTTFPTRQDYRRAVAAKIRFATAVKRVKRHDIIEATGLSPASVSRKIHGHSPITVEELLDISFALDLNPAELVPDTIPTPPKGIAQRVGALAYEVQGIADSLLEGVVTGADLEDWPKWAAAAHALKAADRQLYYIGKTVTTEGKAS